MPVQFTHPLMRISCLTNVVLYYKISFCFSVAISDDDDDDAKSKVLPDLSDDEDGQGTNRAGSVESFH